MDLTQSSVQPGEGVPWAERSNRRATVHFLPGSYAAQNADVELARADRLIAALEELLDPPVELRGQRVDVFLVDPVPPDGQSSFPQEPNVAGMGQGGDEIVRVMDPEGSYPPTEITLTVLLLTRWYGPGPGSDQLLCEGIAGLVAARTSVGPPLAFLDELISEALRDEQLRARVLGAGPWGVFALDPPFLGQASAASFIAFLLRHFGERPFRQFVRTYQSDRRDQAAVDTYQQPLGTLHEAWFAELLRELRVTAPWRALFQRFIPLLRPFWWRFAERFCYTLLGLSATVGLPLMSKYLFDVVLPARQVRGLVLFVAFLSGLYLFNALLSVRNLFVTTMVNQHILMTLQEGMFRKLQRLPHSFHGRAKVGDLMARLSDDSGVIQGAMAQVLGSGVTQVLNAVAAAVTIIALSPRLGLFVVLAVPLVLLANRVFGARLARASFDQQERGGETQSVAQENLLAHGVIKAFGAEDRAVSAFRARLASVFQATRRVVLLGGLFDASVNIATALPQIAVLGVGGYLVIQGDLTLGTLVAFVGLLPSITTPISALADVGQAVQSASGALERVNELLDEPETVSDQPGASDLLPLQRSIQLEHVDVAYSSDRPVLFDVSLTIPVGSNVAIVGPSGSGKSTIVNLLVRFWDPDRGRVLFDGRDAREVGLASLRRQIGLVFQDTFIFDTTVRENIAIGRPGSSDAEIATAARAAQLDTFIESLPGGLDTVLGEGGGRLSGGQRQRLAIARAILREPSVLIFDEATSALDSQTERGLLETLATLQEGHTTITITHRLGLAAGADRIFVLDRGRLVEEGTHESLVRGGGLYQVLFEEQTGVTDSTSRTAPMGNVNLLRSVPLFATMTDEALEALAGRLVPEAYGAGDEIVRQGDPGDRLCVLADGQAEVVVDDGAGERRINLLGPRDFLGEIALLHDGPRRATVRALEPTLVLSLGKDDFLALVADEGHEAISLVLAERWAAYASTPHSSSEA